MQKKLLSIIIVFLLTNQLQAQVFTGTGGAIPDNGPSIDFDIPVSGLQNSIDTLNFGLETICLYINHTWDSDLDISLVAPDGTSVMLTSGNGGGDDNYENTCFNYFAATAITSGIAPFTGTFRPQGQLGLVNNGQNPNGIWHLHIQDTYPFADTGTLLWWSIEFGTSPAKAFFLSSSNLPIIKINTNGQSIINDPKITADMGIIYNGPGVRNYTVDTSNNYNGKIGIELRGHSSQGFPQKQYSFETRDSLGNNLDVSLLGLPPEHDWILYAPYDDKALFRNSLTYFLCNQMGRYASRCVFAELILNGEYKGVYVLMEKIKRDANRVDIANLLPTDTAGDDLTGGYICSIDWADNAGWNSNYPPDQTQPVNNTVFYQYIYPKDIDIVQQQKDYIQLYVDSFETALSGANFTDPINGWRRYADEWSFIDYFLINELSKNVDGYRLSTYFFKDKNSNGGRLQMGPAWDFNLAWRNADYCGNNLNGGWAYRLTDYCSWDFPFWWKRLLQDANFRNHLKCRWQQMQTTYLSQFNINTYIDSVRTYLDESQQRHFNIYPILGVYVWPNPSPLAQTYQDEINYLKTWIGQRISWLNTNLPGICFGTGIDEPAISDSDFVLYPNPANNLITLLNYSQLSDPEIKITDQFGRVINQFSALNLKTNIDVSTFSSGVYFITIMNDEKILMVKKFVKM